MHNEYGERASARNQGGDSQGTQPVSVVLPTVDAIDAVRELVDALDTNDELLVVCDTRTDPVATSATELPAGARLVVAGPPQGCSGKANAVAAGLEAAVHDRIVLTDDDFRRPDSWLDRLRADYRREGPASELPLFVGQDPLSRLLEPLYACGSLALFRSNTAWGGALIFDRNDINQKRVCRELRRTVSDDGLLTEHLDITQYRRTRRVPIGGTIRASIERHVRFVQIFRQFEPRWLVAVSAALAALSLLLVVAPLVVTFVVTGLVGGVYLKLGLKRLTFFYAVVVLMLYVPLLGYALSRRTFVWAGRRYRWRRKFDTVVVGKTETSEE